MLDDLYTNMPIFSDEGAPVCAETDPDLFFPMDVRYGIRYQDEAAAKKLCGTCPYVQRCLLYAMKNPDVMGIWGGTTEKDRAKLARFNRYK